MELAFEEASSICRDLLGILVPTIGPDAPLKLAKVGAPQCKAGRAATSAKLQKTSCLFGPFGPFSGCRKVDKRAEIEQSLHKGPFEVRSHTF